MSQVIKVVRIHVEERRGWEQCKSCNRKQDRTKRYRDREGGRANRVLIWPSVRGVARYKMEKVCWGQIRRISITDGEQSED